MRNIFIAVIISVGSLFQVHSQTVIVIDGEDRKPVQGVDIYNQSKSVVTSTNISGKAEAGLFRKGDIICFHHFAYERACISYEEAEKSGFVVELRKKVFQIEEFVVSANRWEQERNEVPSRISVVPEAEIRFRDPQTSADLIASSGDVFVQKSQLGGGSPMIRGFATNRVLIVIDGVRMNNAIYREGNIQNILSIDPSSVESAEVIFGPGAVVYGSDAIGGVMDFHSTGAYFSSGDKPYLNLNGLTRFSTANNEKTVSLGFNIGGKRISFLSSFSWSDFGHLKMGSVSHSDYLRKEYVQFINGSDSVLSNDDPELQIFSGYNQLSLLNKIKVKVTDKSEIEYSNHYSSLSNVPRYDRLIQYKSGKPRYGEWYYGPQEWMMNSLRASFSGDNTLYDKLKLTVARQDYRESRHDRSFGKNLINEQFEELVIYSVNADADRKLAAGANLLYYGIEYVFNDIKSTARTRDILSGNTEPAGTRYPNGINRYNSFSAYTGYRTGLSGKVTFNTGLRLNYVTLYSTIADNSYYGFPFTTIDIRNWAVTGSAGIVLKSGKSSRISSNLSTGFRAPNLDDAGKVFDSAPGVVVVPNPDLKPEYAINTDLGYTRDFGKLLHFEITGFYTFLKNAMVRGDYMFNGEDSIMYNGEMSKVEAIVNASYAMSFGADLGIELNITRTLRLRSSVNIMEGFEKGGIPLRHATPAFGSTHLIFEKSALKADLYAKYNGPVKFSDMPPSETGKPYMYATDSDGNPWSPGWGTLNLLLSAGFVKSIVINGAVENIFDLRYRPYASGIVSPGRNFIISLRINI